MWVSVEGDRRGGRATPWASGTSSVSLQPTPGAGRDLGLPDLQGSLCFLPRPPGALPHSIMMGKLPLGVVSPYVKMSSGGCADPLKFYATSYCTAYGEGTSLWEPPSGHRAGVGVPS